MQVETAPQPAVKRPALWKLALNLALLIGLVGIFAWQIYKDWPEISRYPWHPHWGYAGMAFALLLVCSALDIFIWNRTLGWFADPLPFRQATGVYIWSYLARYIPGKVGSLILRVALATEVKRDPIPVLASSAVELALRTASALLLFMAALVGWGVALDARLRLLPGLLILLVLVCAHPRIMLPVVNWGLRVLKKPVITRQLRYREVLGIFGVLFARWLLYGLAFAALAAALHPATRLAQVPVLIGAASGSWALGFIGMTPGGLGISEWVIKTIFEHTLHFGHSVADIFPVLFRLWTLLGEGVWALAACLLWRQKTPQP